MTNAPIEEARDLFIRRWGEMGATWGISRTMAELHALLYLASEPLCTDDVMEQLSISRGSASMNLRELVNWGLIRRTHHRGDRKEYFDAERDVWQMFETIMRERRRREVLPIMETIERCISMITADDGKPPSRSAKEASTYHKRFSDIREFCEVMNTVFNLMQKVGHGGVKPLAKTLRKLLG